MSMREIVAEAIRLSVLQGLVEATDHRLSDVLLKRWVMHQVDLIERDVLRGHLQWLADAGLIRLEKLPGEQGEIWRATLLDAGLQVARGKRYPGVAEPELG